jgi:hypothetical protein
MRTHNSKHLRYWYILLFAVLAIGNSGCLVAAAGAAAGAGGAAVYAHYKGVDTNTFDTDVTTVSKSTEDALYDLGMPVVSEKHANNNSVTVKSTTGTGDNVTIDVEPETPKIPTDPTRTKVTVRIAMFGDHEVGMRILHRIDQRVASYHPAMPVVPAPGTPVVSSARPAAPVIQASANGAATAASPVVPAAPPANGPTPANNVFIPPQGTPVVQAGGNNAGAAGSPVVPAAPPGNGPTAANNNVVVPASAPPPDNWKPAQQ